MAKKSLLEAAKDVFNSNIASKQAKGEPFGVDTKHTISNPQGDYGYPEDLGKTGIAKPTAANRNAGEVAGPSKTNTGVAQSSNAGPGGPDYPGPTPPVKSAPRKDIHNNVDDEGKKRVSANDSGIAEEDEVSEEEVSEEGHGEFESGGKAHDIKSLGDKADTEENVEEEEVVEEDTPGNEHKDIPAAMPVSDRVKSYVDSKTKISVQEDLGNLFSGEKLSEEFKRKVFLVFEAAVLAKVQEVATAVCEGIDKEYADKLEESVNEIKEGLETKVDDYLNYVVEEWVKDNEIAIESGLRQELAEDFIDAMHRVFLEHYIDVPEGKVDIVEELAGKVEHLEGRLNEEINKNIDLAKLVIESKREEIIDEVCDGLTDTAKAKIKKLAEGVELTTEEEFKKNIEMLKENYSSVKAPATQKLDEESVEGDPKGIEEAPKRLSEDPEIEAAIKAISRTVVKG